MSDIEQISVRVLPNGRVTRREAAAYLGRTPKTLAVWASRGVGPTPVNVCGRIFYRLDELERVMAGDSAVAA